MYRCQQLMYVFPVLRWLKVFSQTWEGDVTMVLPSSYMQLKKSVTNPHQQGPAGRLQAGGYLSQLSISIWLDFIVAGYTT